MGDFAKRFARFKQLIPGLAECCLPQCGLRTRRKSSREPQAAYGEDHRDAIGTENKGYNAYRATGR